MEVKRKYTRESKVNLTRTVHDRWSFQIEARLVLLPRQFQGRPAHIADTCTVTLRIYRNLLSIRSQRELALTNCFSLSISLHFFLANFRRDTFVSLSLSSRCSVLPPSSTFTRFLYPSLTLAVKTKEKKSLTSRKREQGQGEISKTFQRCPD